jgi:hypothetical protein
MITDKGKSELANSPVACAGSTIVLQRKGYKKHPTGK